MNVSINDSYLPPINNSSLLPNPRQCIDLWKEHHLSLYLLLGCKNYNQFISQCFSVWLDTYCYYDPLFITQWYPFYKNINKMNYLNGIPKHIQLWNHYESRCFSLQLTHRWNNTPFELLAPKFNMKWKSNENTTEGMLKRWGNLPDFKELPIQINYQSIKQWPTAWKLLFRGLITASFYPEQCFIAYNQWDGWSWISSWVQWCSKSLGHVSSIYPVVQTNELLYQIPDVSWIGVAIGWEILEKIMQFRQLPTRSHQDWLVKKFLIIRKIWFSPLLFGNQNDLSQRHLTILYKYLEWVSWFVIYPNRVIENAGTIQTETKKHEQEHIQDYLTLGQIYHQTACQDRSSSKIQQEFYQYLQKIKPQQTQQTQQTQRTQRTQQIQRTQQTQQTQQIQQTRQIQRTQQIQEIQEPRESTQISYFNFIPKKGELSYKKMYAKEEEYEERDLTITNAKIEKQERENEWNELEKWMELKKISNEDHSDND